MTVDNFIPPFSSGRATYIEALSSKLHEYTEFVKNELYMDSYVINKITNLNDLILDAISDIKQANSQQAYNRIDRFIKEEKGKLNFPVYTITQQNPLIRLRYSDVDLLSRRDLFHIPNSLRHLVSQQRYSITGVPCLYLSGCAFTAWLELNKPNFSNLWCSGFRANKRIKVLNCAARLDSIIKEENNIGQLIFYPLVIATSFAVKHPASPFKEEYIISNILLQAIFNNTDLKGIRYFSTKIANYKPEYSWMATNIVLPAVSLQSEYDGMLAESFISTYPQPCSVLMHSPNAGDVVAICMCGMEESDSRTDLANGSMHLESEIFDIYGATQFFNIDGYIRTSLSYAPIDETI